MLKSRNNFIRNYLSVSLMEQHMATLASIIKDVDKDVKGVLCKVSDIFLFLFGFPQTSHHMQIYQHVIFDVFFH